MIAVKRQMNNCSTIFWRKQFTFQGDDDDDDDDGDDDDDEVRFIYTNTFSCIFIVLDPRTPIRR